MRDLHKQNTSKPRKLRETEWFEGGLLFSPARKVIDSAGASVACAGIGVAINLAG